MEKFFYKKARLEESSQSNECRNHNSIQEFPIQTATDKAPIVHHDVDSGHSSRVCDEFNFDELILDPGLRPSILDYSSNIRDKVRQAYWSKGPCQPRNHNFPFTQFGTQSRRFVSSWFDLYTSWLEYSVAKDEAYCLCCYLFGSAHGKQGGGGTFVNRGFKDWRKRDKFQKHVGEVNSAHNLALSKCQAFDNPKHSIEVGLTKQTDESKVQYRTRLTASIDVIRLLLRQGLSFREYDESNESENQENFLELLEFLADHNESVKKVMLSNTSQNLKLTSPHVQKEIVSAIAGEIRDAIVGGMKTELFSIFVDDCRDVSGKEQMGVVLRYVDKKGRVIECFLGIVHVANTTALSLKSAIDSLFSRHELSISRVRGQSYDGASNMQDEFNGLRTLIQRENESAYYIHCFAHQLQPTLVAVAKKHPHISLLFYLIAKLVNTVGVSCKRRDALRESEAIRLARALESGDFVSDQDLNQETSIKRPGETRWGSHYGSLWNLIHMFDSIIGLLNKVLEDATDYDQRGEALSLLNLVPTYDFAFNMHLMKNILWMTNELSKALQKKDQNIVNAINLVRTTKQQLQSLRDHGWEDLLEEVSQFCVKHDIDVLDMGARFVAPGRRKHAEEGTNLDHYRVDTFLTVVDLQISELNCRFSEVTTELLICMACLDPSDDFSAFDKQKLIRLAQFYPYDFSPIELKVLESQLETYIMDMRSCEELYDVKEIGELAIKLVDLKKDVIYPLVYLLLKLVLLLPVATATVERAFSAMKIIKTRLWNRMGDEWMNDSLLCYIEKNIFKTIENEAIIKRYESSAPHRVVI